jgi:type II secretory pathway component PulL
MATRIVVEWTRGSLRLALAEGAGPRRLRALYSRPLSASGDPAEPLQALLRGLKPGDAEVIAVVPREQVLTRIVKFPSIVPEELARMVELYARAQLPYPREQAVMDFRVVRQEEGFSVAGIVACQRAVIDRSLELLRGAGLSPQLVTVSSWGVLGWFRRLPRSSAIPEPSLVVNVDDTRTDLVLVDGARLLLGRSVGQGAADWSGQAETLELLATEVDRTRAALRKELPGIDARSVTLAGLGELAAWREPLSQRLDLPVHVAPPPEPAQGMASSLDAPISPVVVAGLAGSERSELLDLTPPDARAHARHREQVRELVTIGALLAGVLLLGSSVLAVQLVRHQRASVQLDRTLRQIESSARQVQSKTRLARLVESLFEDRRRLAGTLSGVFRLTSPSVTLEALTFDRARQELAVRGSAASTQTVLDYVRALEELEEVRDVELRYTRRRSTAEGDRTDFELALRQRGPS